MATPYSVPSIDDIIYSRSRVPSMQQITFNNLLTAIQKVQESKETQKEREFLLERDRRSEEAATARDRLRVTAQSKRDLAADKWKRGQAKEALRQRNEDLHRQDINESFDLLDSLLDDGSLEAAASGIKKIQTKPGYDAESYGDRLTLHEEDLAFQRAELAKETSAKSIMRDFWNGTMAWEDVVTSDFMVNSTEDQFDRVLRKRNANLSRLYSIEDAVFDSKLRQHDNNITHYRTEYNENYELADDDGKKKLLEDLQDAFGDKDAYIEQELLKRGHLKPKDAKTTRTAADALAELKTFDLRTALSTFYAVAKPGGQMTEDPAVLDAMEAEVKAGRTIPITAADGHYVWFKSRQQAINDGDITEDYRYDEENPPTGVIEAKDDKLLENTKNLSGFRELMETLNKEMASDEMLDDMYKGYGVKQRMSHNTDEDPAGDIWASKPGHLKPDDPKYVPAESRVLFGYVRQIDTQLNKYRKMAIRNKKDKKVVEAAEGVKQWAITQLSQVRNEVSKPGMYDKKTGNLVIKLINTIDSTLERLQDDSWIYKSYGFRPSRRGRQKTQPMGIQQGQIGPQAPQTGFQFSQPIHPLDVR